MVYMGLIYIHVIWDSAEPHRVHWWGLKREALARYYPTSNTKIMLWYIETMLGSTYQEMPLHELRCKWEHMLKSIEQISFNSKREVETEIRKGLWVRGGRDRGGGRGRLSKRCPMWVPAVSCWPFLVVGIPKCSSGTTFVQSKTWVSMRHSCHSHNMEWHVC